MKIDIKNSNKKLLIVLMAILGVAIGFTSAYYQPQSNGSAAANATVMAKTTDVLAFSKGNPISITMTQQNFGRNDNNLTSTSTVMASLLANNDTNSASNTYNVYFNITGNSFRYTTAPTNTPEILLTVTNPSGTPVTSITGLTYTTVNGVSGFDITEQKGLIQIANNYSITSNSGVTATTQTWTITVTLVNLDTNQEANTNKRFSGQAIIQKDAITTAMLDTGTNVNNKLKAIVNYGESNAYPLVAFKRAEALPSGFTATTGNTISLSGSNSPVYIWLGDEYYAVSKGDVNGNGAINSGDFGLIDNCVAGRTTCNEAQQIMGDLNGNGELDSDDVSLIIDCSNGYCSGYSYLPTNAEGASAFASTYGSTATMGTVYFYSEADIIYLNADSSNLFSWLSELKDIDDLYNFSTVNVTNMRDMFNGCNKLAIIMSLTNWNTSSVTNMAGMFAQTNISDLTPLTNWDVSSVIYMGTQYYYDGMFMNIPITSLLPLSNWDVSSVTNMGSLFVGCDKITSLSGLENWDVSSVTDMSSLFYLAYDLANINAISSWDTSSADTMNDMFNSTDITSLASLANWDVSSVTNMYGMFHSTYITSLTSLANWDVSSVISMRDMFGATLITSLSGLENWDVSSVTDMAYMFYEISSLQDVSSINDWNIVSVHNFNYMFGYTPVHPTFSKRSGTWNENGTFVPS